MLSFFNFQTVAKKDKLHPKIKENLQKLIINFEGMSHFSRYIINNRIEDAVIQPLIDLIVNFPLFCKFSLRITHFFLLISRVNKDIVNRASY